MTYWHMYVSFPNAILLLQLLNNNKIWQPSIQQMALLFLLLTLQLLWISRIYLCQTALSVLFLILPLLLLSLHRYCHPRTQTTQHNPTTSAFALLNLPLPNVVFEFAVLTFVVSLPLHKFPFFLFSKNNNEIKPVSMYLPVFGCIVVYHSIRWVWKTAQ